MKCLVVNYEKCRGCYCCALACSFKKSGEFNINKSNISVRYFPRMNLPVPVICEQCSDAACIEACPEEAIYRENETGAVIIDQEVCIGCGICITACPIEVPREDPDEQKVKKCDLCGGDPECVKYCGYEALQYIHLENTALQRDPGAEKVAQILANYS